MPAQLYYLLERESVAGLLVLCIILPQLRLPVLLLLGMQAPDVLAQQVLQGLDVYLQFIKKGGKMGLCMRVCPLLLLGVQAPDVIIQQVLKALTSTCSKVKYLAGQAMALTCTCKSKSMPVKKLRSC